MAIRMHCSAALAELYRYLIVHQLHHYLTLECRKPNFEGKMDPQKIEFFTIFIVVFLYFIKRYCFRCRFQGPMDPQTGIVGINDLTGILGLKIVNNIPGAF